MIVGVGSEVLKARADRMQSLRPVADRRRHEDRQMLSRRWYILHYHRSTLLLPLGERLLLVVVEWKREAK